MCRRQWRFGDIVWRKCHSLTSVDEVGVMAVAPTALAVADLEACRSFSNILEKELKAF